MDMTVAYTLSWEEYAEQFERSWSSRSLLEFYMAIIIATPLLIYGLGLAYFGLQDEKAVLALFIGGPLALILMAIPGVMGDSSRVKVRAGAEAHSRYERWHSKEQKFSFDGEKWIHETETGRLEAPWSALLLGAEFKSVFVLHGDGHPAIVPKRALDPEVIQQLRQNFLPSGGDAWSFRVSSWDNHIIKTGFLWKKQWFWMLLGNISGLLGLGWILQTLVDSNKKLIDMWGWLLALVVVVMVLTAQLWYLPLSYATSAKSWRLPMKLQLSDRGIYFVTSVADFFMAWKAFLKFKELKHAFLIYTEQGRYYLVAKRYITPDQQEKLRGALLANVPHD